MIICNGIATKYNHIEKTNKQIKAIVEIFLQGISMLVATFITTFTNFLANLKQFFHN